jgi:hypothetical protein
VIEERRGVGSEDPDAEAAGRLRLSRSAVVGADEPEAFGKDRDHRVPEGMVAAEAAEQEERVPFPMDLVEEVDSVDAGRRDDSLRRGEKRSLPRGRLRE